MHTATRLAYYNVLFLQVTEKYKIFIMSASFDLINRNVIIGAELT